MPKKALSRHALVIYESDDEIVVCSKEDEDQIVKERLGRKNGRPLEGESHIGSGNYMRREFPNGVAFIQGEGFCKLGVYE